MEVSPDAADGAAALYLKHRTSQWVASDTALRVLKYLHFAYPLILLVYFITTTTAHSIISTHSDAGPDDANTESYTGPGGKALPKKKGAAPGTKKDVVDFSRPRKLLFEWLALGATLTFVGNSITVIVHALYSRDEEWWCGQATVVSHAPPSLLAPPSASPSPPPLPPHPHQPHD